MEETLDGFWVVGLCTGLLFEQPIPKKQVATNKAAWNLYMAALAYVWNH